jgi:hypothetical protein
MKKLILFIFYSGIALSIYAQYPIPSYNVPVCPRATFTEKGIVLQSKKNAPAGKKVIIIHIVRQTSDSIRNTITVYVYSLDGTTILGPFYVTSDTTLTVQIDERDWGVLVNDQYEVEVSVWIEELAYFKDLEIWRFEDLKI